MFKDSEGRHKAFLRSFQLATAWIRVVKIFEKESELHTSGYRAELLVVSESTLYSVDGILIGSPRVTWSVESDSKAGAILGIKNCVETEVLQEEDLVDTAEDAETGDI